MFILILILFEPSPSKPIHCVAFHLKMKALPTEKQTLPIEKRNTIWFPEKKS